MVQMKQSLFFCALVYVDLVYVYSVSPMNPQMSYLIAPK